MILGFAHLAINVDDIDVAEAEWKRRGYMTSARYFAVPNHPYKRAFTAHHVEQHDLLLMQAPGAFSLELTHHGPTHGQNTLLAWSSSSITLRTGVERELVAAFLEQGFGFRAVGGDEWELSGRFAHWGCRLRLSPDPAVPPRLDAHGPTCLAFYSSRIDDDARQLTALGATEMTRTFDLTPGERPLRIAMARMPGSALIELIQPKTRTL